ncbi:MAG: zinc transporter ZntB [Planctomycetes bacterium]|nr:zinc transporter ZntB [Planctomycetota bacterium]
MKEEAKDPLLIVLALDGKGGGRPLRGPEVQFRAREDGGTTWIHLDVDHPEAAKLLAEKSALPEDLREALLASETRPRAHHEGQGLFLIVRGINLNPGEEPDDMVSLRLWLEPGLVISARRQRIVATRDVEALLAKGKGPRNVGEFLVAILEILIRRIGELVNLLEEKGDDVQERVLAGGGAELRTPLSSVRRQVVTLRRHMAPQRESLVALLRQPPPWLAEAQRDDLAAVVELHTRYVEDLQALHDRLIVTQEELGSHQAETLNRRLYVLSLVTALFLPLTFLTGLLGINVGGIPWAEDPQGFFLVTGVLGALCVAVLGTLKALRWF